MTVIGFDTSNYTTSAACYGEKNGGVNQSRLLDVPSGSLGLRQSDALFQHVKRLPEMAAKLAQSVDGEIAAVGASAYPREVEGSYMPCFLAGLCQARTMAALLGVPCYEFSHQQGHIAAAAFSSGRSELLDSPMLAWHLSGGTTELLLVEPDGLGFRCAVIGGTTDISAGQLIDRTGKLLGLDFPAGKSLDALADDCDGFRVRLDGLSFSLSGVENKTAEMKTAGASHGKIAGFVLSTVAEAVKRASAAAMEQYGVMPLLFTGGVASNSMLRLKMPRGIFAPPKFSTDNALGIAALTWRMMKGR